MKDRIKKSLQDILVSITSINDFIGDNKSYDDYCNNKLLRRAVEREIEIIGEAVNRIKKEKPDFLIENSRKIIDTRNWVIHAYDAVDNTIIWGIVSLHLPKLKTEIENILNSTSNKL